MYTIPTVRVHGQLIPPFGRPVTVDLEIQHVERLNGFKSGVVGRLGRLGRLTPKLVASWYFCTWVTTDRL